MRIKSIREKVAILETAILTLLGAFLLGCSFRSLSVPILASFAIAHAFRSRGTGILSAWLGLLFIVSLVQPLDIFRTDRYTLFGTKGRGLRFVPIVFGLPNHMGLRQSFPEYACGGCCVPIIPPKWVLTWN